MVKQIIEYKCERCDYIGDKEFAKDKCPACGDGHAIVYRGETKMRCDNCNKRLTRKDYAHGTCLGCGKSEKSINDIKRLTGQV
jgi:Zn finger protein HypA/HybF involved in hydrogenase expression